MRKSLLLLFLSLGLEEAAFSQEPKRVEVVVPGEGVVPDLRVRYGESPMVTELISAYAEAAEVGYSDSFNRPREEDIKPLTHLIPALSHFLAALKVADFESESAAALSAAVGERPGPWISWAIREKRLPELLDNVNTAMKRSANRKASWGATCFVRDLLAGLIYFAPPESMLPLLETVKQRHPHMLFHKTRDWIPLVDSMANQGRGNDARSLAQAILLAPEPNPPVLTAIGREGFSRSGIWEQHREDQFKPLLRVALSPPDDEFLAQWSEAVKSRLDDRELVAAWLGALALSDKLTPDVLSSAKGWTDLERFKAARIVARIEPKATVASVFRPWLVAGLKAIFESHRPTDELLPIELIKAAGGHEDFQAILDDAMTARMRNEGQFDPPSLWNGLASVIVAVGAQRHQKKFLDAFLEECRRCTQPKINGYAGDHQHYLAQLVTALPNELKPRAAEACADLFRIIAADERKRGGDPNPWNVRETLFALIAAGDHDGMEKLANELEVPAIEQQKRCHTDTPLFIEEMRVLSRFVTKKPGAAPRAVVWFRQAKDREDLAEVVWEWVLDPSPPKGMPQERIEYWGLAVARPGTRESTARLGLRSDLLRARDGDFDLIVKAGASRDSMVEVFRIEGAKAAGATAVKAKLPDSGWLLGTLVARATGESYAGDPVPYSLLQTITKSGDEPDGGTGQPTVAALMREVKIDGLMLDPSFHANFGRPVTGVFPINPHSRYLLTAWTSWDSDSSGYPRRAPDLQFLHFVWLDEHKQVLRNCHDSSVTPVCRDCYSRNLVARFTQDVIDPFHRFQGEEGGGDGDKIGYLMITAFQGDWTVAPLFQLRPIELEE